MIKIKKNYRLFVWFTFLCSILNPSSLDAQFFQRLSEYLFGTENVAPELQRQFTDACHAFRIIDVPVKYIYDDSYLNSFTSFTCFSIFINKKEWHEMSKEEKQFSQYHEVAHAAKKHLHKQIFLTVVSFLVSLGPTHSLGALYLKNHKSPTQKYFAIFLGMCGIAAATTIPIPFVARAYEREADIAVAQKLCEQGKANIVRNYIAKLKDQLVQAKQKGNYSEIWFPSLPEQIAYLETALLNTKT